MSETVRRGRQPNRSQLADVADQAVADAAIPPGFPVPDGLVAGRERMERMRQEEEERREREEARIAAAAMGEVQVVDDGTPRRVTRESRKPFGSQNQKLFLADRPGFHRHWFNEFPGRIEEALAAGYAHVMDARGQPISRIVGRTDRGDGLRAYAMEIPDEWFREDMQRGQELVDSRAAGIKRGDLYPVDHGYLSNRTKVSDNSR